MIEIRKQCLVEAGLCGLIGRQGRGQGYVRFSLDLSHSSDYNNLLGAVMEVPRQRRSLVAAICPWHLLRGSHHIYLDERLHQRTAKVREGPQRVGRINKSSRALKDPQQCLAS